MSLIKHINREPDEVIGPVDNPYMLRWFIKKEKDECLYLHKICRSDDSRALHDHRADNQSIIIDGEYTEIYAPACGQKIDDLGRVLNFNNLEYDLYRPVKRILKAGDFTFRKAEQPHRLMLHDGPVWTLWRKLVDRRDWGFWVNRHSQDYGDNYVWQHWEEYHKEFGEEI